MLVYLTCQVQFFVSFPVPNDSPMTVNEPSRSPRRNLVDVPFVIRHRLEELGLEQQDLARAARVTDSYISQLLTRKKAPPAPNRTDIYARIDKFLKLPNGELAKTAELQRTEELKRELGEAPVPLYHVFRALVLRTRNAETEKPVAPTFETQPF